MKRNTIILALIISFSSLTGVNHETEKLNLVVVNYDVPADTVPIYPPV